MSKCIVPGTFDPIHRGHISVIERASKIFDDVVVAVAESKEKSPKYNLEERVNFAKEKCSNFKNVEVKSFDCLLVDFVKSEGAKCVARGLRNCEDFEYESNMLGINKKISKDFETIYFLSDPENVNISSSQIRELESLGFDTSKLL